MSDLSASVRGLATLLLHQALDSKLRVVVVIKGDPERGVAPRRCEGIPIAFRPTSDGRERIILEVVEGETQQMILMDKILSVNIIR